MRRYLYRAAWITFAVAALLTSSQEVRSDDQAAVGGLYRDGVLVDSFVEALPTQPSGPRGEAQSTVVDAAPPVGTKAQAFREGVQPPGHSAETQSRNRVFARAADAGTKMRELLRRMSARRGEDLGTNLQSLQALLQEFEAAHADAREALGQIDDRITELGLDQSVRQRHLKAVRAFEEGSEELRTAISDVIDGKRGALRRALRLVQRLKFREDPPLLSPGLPFQRHVLAAPRLTREEADAAAPQALVQAASPSARVMALSPPTPDELAETPDIQFTPEITAKAAQLGNSAQAIYEFVRNNVSFQAYLGSRKGAANTLEQLRGNDTDQASLLLALLRVSGIPSRYVRGTVEMDPERVMRWLGVDDAATAASILTTEGLDGVAITSGPDVVAVRSTHVWVEAYVPYSNYRGVPNDDTGPTWVPLDPSFKENDITPGEDVLTPMGFDVDTFIANYISSVSDPDPLEQLELDIQAYLDANDPGKTVADIERIREIAPQVLGLLPATPPYPVLSISDRLSELEASKRYKVRFHLYDGGTDFIDHTLDLPKLAGKRLTIEYVGATPADQAVIDSFGGIYETPPNLVDVKPVLKLDGAAVATSSNSIGMGYKHSSDMEFIEPVGASNVRPLIQNEIIAGNGQAIAFDTFLDVHDSFLGGDAFPPEDFLEAVLHATATDYLSRVDRGLEKAERLMGEVTTYDVSEAIVENAIAVSLSFGVPVTFEWTGLTVDADRRIIGTFDVDGDGSQDLPYMKLTGIHGSLMENRIFEEMFEEDAVSTVKILQLASEAGIGICTIQTSVFGDCPGITQPSNIISTLNAALALGHVITIPEDPITVSLWSGTGYIDLDPTTGAGGYIISGGSSGTVQSRGGATVESWPVTLPCVATGVTGDVLDPSADSPDPSAVFCADNTPVIFRVEFTTTCEEGPPKTHQQTFTTSKTKEQLGGGHYTLQLVAFGSNTIIRKITIVEVEHLDASEGEEWDDGDGSDDTKTFLLKKDTTGNVTVTATPKPSLAEANLPACWSLTGGTGSGKLTRTVSKATAAETPISATAGVSNKKLTVGVIEATFDKGAGTYGWDSYVPDVGSVLDRPEPEFPVMSVKVGASDSTQLEVDPSGLAAAIYPAATATSISVSPSPISTSPEMLTVFASFADSLVQIEARAGSSSASPAGKLHVKSKGAISKTLMIIQINELNDDVQVVPHGATTPDEDTICVEQGMNGQRETVLLGDDKLTLFGFGNDIQSGPNKICDSVANDIDGDGVADPVVTRSVPPPSSATLKSYLNNVYKGAVIDWTVIQLPSKDVHYDFDGNMRVQLPTWFDSLLEYLGGSGWSSEMQEIIDKAGLTTPDHMLFYTQDSDLVGGGFVVCGMMKFNQRYGFIFTGCPADEKQIAAHELGHGQGLRHTDTDNSRPDTDPTNLMFHLAGAARTDLRAVQWDLLNP